MVLNEVRDFSLHQVGLLSLFAPSRDTVSVYVYLYKLQQTQEAIF